MRGIRSFMGWSHIPDVDNATTTSADNRFAGPKATTPGKASVQMPTEDWLCRKLGKLNVTLVEGYPSHGSEGGGLSKDVFLRPAKSQSKWYGLFSDHKVDPSAISSWSKDASKLNSYSQIARHSGLSSTRRDAYMSHLRTVIKPDTLTALRTAPLHIPTLFSDSAIKRAEEDIAQFESKGHSGSMHNKGRYHPYERQEKRSNNRDSRSDKPAWKSSGKRHSRKGKGRSTTYSS